MKKVLFAALSVSAIIGAVLVLVAELEKPSPAGSGSVAPARIPTVPQSVESSLAPRDAATTSTLEGGSMAAQTSDVLPTVTCPDFRPDLSHPWLVAEIDRLGPLAPMGPSMAVYRGLKESDLKSLAAQRDSGAMMVLGRRAELRAEGKPEEDAVSLLSGLDGGPRVWGKTKQLEEDERAALVEAEHWYYQAVLHGRLFAMIYVGMMREVLYGGPVALGWVDEQDYAKMDPRQRMHYLPILVYFAAAEDLAQEVEQSPMFMLALEGIDLKKANSATVGLVVNELRTDIQQNGLSLPEIPAYDGPGIDEWREEFCRD